MTAEYYQKNKVAIWARAKIWKQNHRDRVNELQGLRRNPNYHSDKLERQRRKLELESLRIAKHAEAVNIAIENFHIIMRKYFRKEFRKLCYRQLRKDFEEITRIRIAA